MLDPLIVQQLLANQRAAIMQAQNMSMEAAGHARFGQLGTLGAYPGGFPVGSMINPLAPRPPEIGTAATAIGAAGVTAGLGLLSWFSMAHGFHRMGTLPRMAVGIFDPFTMGLGGFVRGLRGVMRGYGMAPEAGFLATMRAIPNLYARAGVMGLLRGAVGGALGAALWAAPTIGAFAGLGWAGQQLAIGASQFGQMANLLGMIRPYTGMIRPFEARDIQEFREVLLEYARGGYNPAERLMQGRQLLYATGLGQEYRNVRTPREFVRKFRQLLRETQTVAAILETNLADAYTVMKQTTAMGFYQPGEQRRYLLGAHWGALGTGVDRATLMQVGLAGSEIASMFRMRRGLGAIRATQLTTGLIQAARSNLISGERISELTGMTIEQGAPTLATRMLQAAPTAMQSELGQTVIAALMDRTGQLDAAKVAMFRSGALTWRELRRMARRNLVNKRLAAVFATRRTELTGQLMTTIPAAELIERLGGTYAEYARTDPLTGMQALTGLSREEVTMLRRVEENLPELERRSIFEGQLRQFARLREQYRARIMDPGRIIRRLREQLLGPIERRIQDFGAKINERITNYINRYLDQMINVQTRYVSKRFDELTNAALRGFLTPEQEHILRGLGAIREQFPAFARALRAPLGSPTAFPGGRPSGIFGPLLPTSIVPPQQAGLLRAAMAELGIQGPLPGFRFGGEPIPAEAAFFTSPEEFAIAGGLESIQYLAPRFWGAVRAFGEQYGGPLGGWAAMAAVHPLTQPVVWGAARGVWELGQRFGAVGYRALTLRGPLFRGDVTRIAVPVSRARMIFEPLWRGTSFSGLGPWETGERLYARAIERLGGRFPRLATSLEKLPVIGTAVDTLRLGKGLGAGVIRVGRGAVQLAKGIVRRIAWPVQAFVSFTDTYAFHEQQKAYEQILKGTGVERAIVADLVRKKYGLDLETMHPLLGRVVQQLDIAGKYGRGARLRTANITDLAKHFMYGMTLAPGEIIGGETFRKAIFGMFDIVEPGQVEGLEPVKVMVGGQERTVYVDIRRAGITKEKLEELATWKAQVPRESPWRIFTGGLFKEERRPVDLTTFRYRLIRETGAAEIFTSAAVRFGEKVYTPREAETIKKLYMKVFEVNRGRGEEVRKTLGRAVGLPRLAAVMQELIANPERPWTPEQWEKFEGIQKRLELQLDIPYAGGVSPTYAVSERYLPQGFALPSPEEKRGHIQEVAARAAIAGFLGAVAKTPKGVSLLKTGWGDVLIRSKLQEFLDTGANIREALKRATEFGYEIAGVRGAILAGRRPTQRQIERLEEAAGRFSEVTTFPITEFSILLERLATASTVKAAQSVIDDMNKIPAVIIAQGAAMRDYQTGQTERKEEINRVRNRWNQGLQSTLAMEFSSGSPFRKALETFMEGFKGETGEIEMAKLSQAVIAALSGAGTEELKDIVAYAQTEPFFWNLFGRRAEQYLAIRQAWRKRRTPLQAVRLLERMLGVDIYGELQPYERAYLKRGIITRTLEPKLARILRRRFQFAGTPEEQLETSYEGAEAIIRIFTGKKGEEQIKEVEKLASITFGKVRRPIGGEVSGEQINREDFEKLLKLLGDGVEVLRDIKAGGIKLMEKPPATGTETTKTEESSTSLEALQQLFQNFKGQ